MVSVDNLRVEFGGFTLLNDLSFVINKKDRIALVGKNGAGKSTLLKIIAGFQQATSGSVGMPKDFSIGYLPQVMKCADTQTVFQEAELAFSEIFVLQEQVEELRKQLEERSDYESKDYQLLIEELSRKDEILHLSGVYNYKAEVEKTLLGLGFLRSDFNRATNEFSGGWRMRIELAKVLLRKPDILLLDEPTNHLDIESIQWLEHFLTQNSKAVFLVSHDKTFLDTVCTRTIEISLGKIYDYKLPYSKFLEARKERREQQLRTYENQQKMIQDTEAFIERFRYKATKAVQVQSRIKQLNRLERFEVDEEDTAAMHLKFPPAPHSGSFPIVIEDLSKSYGDHLVLKDVNLSIRRGEKVAFVGRNGEGKSTLVKCILQEIPYEGHLQLGHLVKIAYFAQNQAQLLDENLSVFETIDQIATGEIRTKIKNILGAFMFGGEASDKKVKVLSGGERSRLAMIRLLLEPANLLILDEPTNHLDIRSKDVLKQAVKDFNGTVVVVSHDRDFLDGLVDKVYEFGGQKVKEHLGGIKIFLEKKKMENLREIESRQKESSAKEENKGSVPLAAKQAQASPGKTRAENAPMLKMSYDERKQYNKQLKKLEQAVENCEADVARHEETLAALETALSTPQGAGDKSLHGRYAETKKQLDNAMSYWEAAVLELDRWKKA